MSNLSDLPTFVKDTYGKTYQLKTGELTRLEIDDSHYYFLDNEYYPGVTTILSEAAPVSQSLRLWWQTKSKDEIDDIFSTRQGEGSNVHNAIDSLLKGKVLNTSDFNEKERKCLVAFIDWFRYFKPTEFQGEQPIASKQFRFAGTLDFVMMINGERWLIDFKTSSAIHFSHELQILAYKQAYEESYGLKVDRCFILRVGSSHKGTRAPKEGEIKQVGAGWEFKPVTDYTIETFSHVYQLYLALHGGQIPEPPAIQTYPPVLQLLQEA